MEKKDFDAIPASALNMTCRQLLSNYLNPEKQILSSDTVSRDYRGLAEQMGFSYVDICNFKIRGDPTMKILEQWTVLPGATIGQLIEFLETMGRHDVIQLLQAHFEDDAKKHLQLMERGLESPLQVPEVTSCPSQSYQTTERNILTCEDAFTGEPTYYDAYISYADEDWKFAYNLFQFLESNGFKLFFRHKDLLAGHSEYETNMRLIQERCKRVLIVLSPNFIKCPACEVQATFASSLGYAEKRRKIVPILLKPCTIPFSLQIVSKIDFTKPDCQDWIWSRLILSLKDVPSDDASRKESLRLSPERRTGLNPIESSSDTNNPAITFPSTTSYSLISGTSSSPCSSSVQLVQDEITNDPNTASVKSVTTSKPISKLHNLLFGPSRKIPKKRRFSSTSVSSSSNDTNQIHNHNGSGSDSINNSNAQDTRV